MGEGKEEMQPGTVLNQKKVTGILGVGAGPGIGRFIYLNAGNVGKYPFYLLILI